MNSLQLYFRQVLQPCLTSKTMNFIIACDKDEMYIFLCSELTPGWQEDLTVILVQHWLMGHCLTKQSTWEFEQFPVHRCMLFSFDLLLLHAQSFSKNTMCWPWFPKPTSNLLFTVPGWCFCCGSFFTVMSLSCWCCCFHFLLHMLHYIWFHRLPSRHLFGEELPTRFAMFRLVVGLFVLYFFP